MISATLVGSSTPKEVQIVIPSIPPGARWRLTGHTADWEWVVPGGEGVGDGGQVALLDNRAPGNQPTIYLLSYADVTVESNEIVVPMEHEMILQSGDGTHIVPVRFLKGAGDTRRTTNQALFRVARRRRPVVRHDVTGDIEGMFRFLVDMRLSSEFEALIESGEPIYYRVGQRMADLPPVACFAFWDPESVALLDRSRPGEGHRLWEMQFALVDDPVLDVRLGSASWDEIETITAGVTWDEIEARFAGLTWDEIDRLDWSTF